MNSCNRSIYPNFYFEDQIESLGFVDVPQGRSYRLTRNDVTCQLSNRSVDRSDGPSSRQNPTLTNNGLDSLPPDTFQIHDGIHYE
jgi:hypothetical protein